MSINKLIKKLVKETKKMQEIKDYMQSVGENARTAAREIAKADTGKKNKALEYIADAIDAAKDSLGVENQKDMQAGVEKGLDAALLDRLELTPDRIDAMSEGLRQMIALPDPIGEISDMNYRPSGIQVGKMRVPLGVIGIIYESRPNVTADAAGLCLKAGNAAILRGGSEAIHSNKAIAACIKLGLAKAGLPADVVQVIETTDRAAVGELITMKDYVDVIVPRGGKGLIERVTNEARVPVIKHLDGVCHVFIDAKADIKKAVDVAFNAKTQRYGTCNTLETLLVHEAIAGQVMPQLVSMYQEKGVELRVCEKSAAYVDNGVPATEDDWYEEYLAPVLAVKIVANIDEAIDHIEKYSSRHTEAIITEDFSNAQKFMREVDSSSVMVNASTRFADGFEYGFGAEIGISTDKIHARGPVGLEGLTTQKFIVIGDGHIRG